MQGLTVYDANTMEEKDVSEFLTLESDSCDGGAINTGGGGINRRLAALSGLEVWLFDAEGAADMMGEKVYLILAPAGVLDPENSGMSITIDFLGAANTPPYFSGVPPNFSLAVGETGSYSLPFFQDDEDNLADLSLSILINGSGSYPPFITVSGGIFILNPNNNA